MQASETIDLTPAADTVQLNLLTIAQSAGLNDVEANTHIIWMGTDIVEADATAITLTMTEERESLPFGVRDNLAEMVHGHFVNFEGGFVDVATNTMEDSEVVLTEARDIILPRVDCYS